MFNSSQSLRHVEVTERRKPHVPDTPKEVTYKGEMENFYLKCIPKL